MCFVTCSLWRVQSVVFGSVCWYCTSKGCHWIASIRMSCLAYPARWPVIALSTPLRALQCSNYSASLFRGFVTTELVSLYQWEEEESARTLGVLDVDG